MAPGTEGLSSTCGYSMDHYGSVWICMVDIGISRDSMISILHKRSETLGIPTNVTTLNSSMEISLEKSGSKNMCRVREKDFQVKRWMMRKWMQNPTSSFFELKSHSWRFWVEWWGRWLRKLVGRGIFDRLHSSHSFHCSETTWKYLKDVWNFLFSPLWHMFVENNNKNRGVRLNLHWALIMPWPTDQASKPAVSSTRKKAKLCKWSRP